MTGIIYILALAAFLFGFWVGFVLGKRWPRQADAPRPPVNERTPMPREEWASKATDIPHTIYGVRDGWVIHGRTKGGDPSNPWRSEIGAFVQTYRPMEPKKVERGRATGDSA